LVGTETAGGEEWSVQRVWKTSESEQLLSRLDSAFELLGFDIDSSESSRVTATKNNLTVWAGANHAVGDVQEEFFVRATTPQGEPDDAYSLLQQLDVALSGSS
jgi:hypothetical protein